jgi:hypothetical protein
MINTNLYSISNNSISLFIRNLNQSVRGLHLLDRTLETTAIMLVYADVRAMKMVIQYVQHAEMVA